MAYSTQVFPVLYCVLDLLKFMSIEVVMPSSHLILWHPLLLLPLVFLSIRFFSSELAFHIRWPKYWSLSIVPSNKYSGLISFRIDWFGLLAIQGPLKSLLQHHSLKSASLTSNFYYGSLKRAEPRLTDTENEFMVTKGEMCGRGREKIRSVG